MHRRKSRKNQNFQDLKKYLFDKNFLKWYNIGNEAGILRSGGIPCIK